MVKNITTTVEHAEGEFVTIHKRSSLYMGFARWGTSQGWNIINVMIDMTRPEQKLFRDFTYKVNPKTNEVYLEPPVSNSENVERSKAARKLVARGVVKKIGIRKWMINPWLMVPGREERETLAYKWESLK